MLLTPSWLNAGPENEANIASLDYVDLENSFNRMVDDLLGRNGEAAGLRPAISYLGAIELDTYEHSVNVARLVYAFYEKYMQKTALQGSELAKADAKRRLNAMVLAGLLHDFGKISPTVSKLIHSSEVYPPGSEERKTIAEHGRFGVKALISVLANPSQLDPNLMLSIKICQVLHHTADDSAVTIAELGEDMPIVKILQIADYTQAICDENRAYTRLRRCPGHTNEPLSSQSSVGVIDQELLHEHPGMADSYFGVNRQDIIRLFLAVENARIRELAKTKAKMSPQP